jgi:hypothetical protein
MFKFDTVMVPVAVISAAVMAPVAVIAPVVVRLAAVTAPVAVTAAAEMLVAAKFARLFRVSAYTSSVGGVVALAVAVGSMRKDALVSFLVVSPTNKIPSLLSSQLAGIFFLLLPFFHIRGATFFFQTGTQKVQNFIFLFFIF